MGMPAQISRIAHSVWNLDRADSGGGLIDSLAVAG
jgi:hypothetical protein